MTVMRRTALVLCVLCALFLPALPALPALPGLHGAVQADPVVKGPQSGALVWLMQHERATRWMMKFDRKRRVI